MCETQRLLHFSRVGDGFPRFAQGGCTFTKYHKVPRQRVKWHLSNIFTKNSLSFGPAACCSQWESPETGSLSSDRCDSADENDLVITKERLFAGWPGPPPPVLPHLKKDCLEDDTEIR